MEREVETGVEVEVEEGEVGEGNGNVVKEASKWKEWEHSTQSLLQNQPREVVSGARRVWGY